MLEIDVQIQEGRNWDVREVLQNMFEEWYRLEYTQESNLRFEAPESEAFTAYRDDLFQKISSDQSPNREAFAVNKLTSALEEINEIFSRNECVAVKAYLYAQRGYFKERRATYGDLAQLPKNHKLRVLCYLSAAADYMQHDIIGEYGPSQGVRIFEAMGGAGLGIRRTLALEKFFSHDIDHLREIWDLNYDALRVEWGNFCFWME